MADRGVTNGDGGRPYDMTTTWESEHPGWRIWRSDGGCWWATRRHRVSDRQLNAGYEATVCGDDADELRRALARQHAIEDRARALPR